jgi:hypothetical protein
MATLPLRSKLPWRGSDYAPALAAHWGDQVPEKYKRSWGRLVTKFDEGGIRFTQNYNWPERYYLGYAETYSQTEPRPADLLLTNNYN